MNRYIWLINRLRAMSIKEVGYRVNNKLKKVNYKKVSQKRYKISEIEKLSVDYKKLNNNLSKMFNDCKLDDLSMSLEYDALGTKYNLNEEIAWHQGMYSEWDKDTFSKDMDFKNTDDIGDVRFSWEINRHIFMPFLASKYISTNDKYYLDILQEAFNNFEEENRFLNGINWSSSMEIAIRAYQWLICLFLLKDSNETDDFKNRLINSLVTSIKYVEKNLSLYSSANNHLILEAAIMGIVGIALKDIYKQDWYEKSEDLLENNLYKQFHEDGVNKEQALHYQGFVTDMMLQYNSIMKNINLKTIGEDIIKKSVVFLGNISSDIYHFDFGDSDDAKIISIENKKLNYYKYLLSFASFYYDEKFIENPKLIDSIRIFVGDKEISDSYNYNEFSLYKKGGYGIIKNDSLLAFDFGELGFGSLAAHGHADALMFLYAYKGKKFFVDSGTFIYNIKSKKRNYYRSTKSHNTLCYKEKDQSEILGPFLWGKKAKTELISYLEEKDKYLIKAKHSGYNPFEHIRTIEYFKENECLKIIDEFEDFAVINFILDKKIKTKKLKDNMLLLENGDIKLYMYTTAKSKVIETFISDEFLKESITNKIECEFKDKHITIIGPNEEIVRMLSGEKR